MHDCPYRKIEHGNIRCQNHIDEGVIDALITPGACEQCLFFQSRGVDIKTASFRLLNHYITQKLLNISIMPRELAIALFDKAFKISTKIYIKEHAITFLSDALVKFSKNPYIFETDIEIVYDKVRRFEEA